MTARGRMIAGLGLAATLIVAVAVAGTVAGSKGPAYRIRGADAGRGRQAIEAYHCGSCHTIPGVSAADALVGPPLSHWASRVYIAGMLHNDPPSLERWIMNPQRVVPGNAMPDLGVSRRDAGDIAQYLYGLR
jgi:cytochrome c